MATPTSLIHAFAGHVSRLRTRCRPLLIVGACAFALGSAAATQAAAPPASISAGSGAPTAFWACTYRDIAPPNWEYVRYIEASNSAEAEARMRAELPPHQSLVGCRSAG